MTIDDRFTRGFIGGVIGALAQFIITLPTYYLGITKLRWLDFANVLTHGHEPINGVESIFSELVMIVWSGGLGILFTFLIPYIENRNYRLKGILYGGFVWFAVYAVTVFAKLPILPKINTPTAIVHAAASLLWGFIMVETIKRLEDRIDAK
jgi:hypothetical protein